MKIKNDPYNIDYASLSDSNRAWSIPVKADGTYRLGSEAWNAPNDVVLKTQWTENAKPLYWYVGTDPITTSTTPGSGTVTTDETTLGWHNISGTPTEIQVGPTPRQSANVTWYIAIPNTLGITKATSGGLTDGTVTSTTMTLSDGVVYRVFTTAEAKKVDYLMIK